MKTKPLFFVMVFVVSVLGCGEVKSGSASDAGVTRLPGAPPWCPNIAEPCGGSLVGSWNLTSACVRLPQQLANPTCDIFIFGQISGSIVFNADGTYRANVASIDISTSATTECLAQAGEQCDGTGCATSEGFCACSKPDQNGGNKDISSGTYAVGTGNTFTMQNTSAEKSFVLSGVPMGYCTKDNILYITVSSGVEEGMLVYLSAAKEN